MSPPTPPSPSRTNSPSRATARATATPPRATTAPWPTARSPAHPAPANAGRGAPGPEGSPALLSSPNALPLNGGGVPFDLAGPPTTASAVNDLRPVPGSLNLNGSTARAVNRLNGALAD